MNAVSRRGLLAGSASGAGLAVLPPRRPDQQYRPGQAATSPGARSIVRARQVIVSGKNDGVFIYSGQPALGNLIGSWAAQAGVDAKGNAYPQGLSVALGVITGATFEGTDFIVNSSGAFFYSGTPAAGNLIAAIAPAAGTDQFGNQYYQGYLSATGEGAGNKYAIFNSGQLVFKEYGGSSLALMGVFPQSDYVMQIVSGQRSPAFAQTVMQLSDYATGGTPALLLAPAGSAAVTSDYAEIQGALAVTTGGAAVTGGTVTDTLSAGGGAVTVAANGKVAVSAGGLNPLVNVTDTSSGPSNSNIRATSNAAGDPGLGTIVAGDAHERAQLRSDASLWLGSGAAAPDTNLYRGAANIVRTDDSLAITQAAAPANLANTGQLYADSGPGELGQIDVAGLQTFLSGSQLAQVGGTTVTTVNITALGSLNVPGGDIVAGSSFRWHASGSFGMGTTPSNARMLLYWGGTGGTIIAEIDPPITAGLSGAGWACDGEVNWITKTSCEVTMYVWWHNAAGAVGTVVEFVVTLTTGLSTSGANNLTLAWKWGSVPAGTTLTCDTIRFGKAA